MHSQTAALLALAAVTIQPIAASAQSSTFDPGNSPIRHVLLLSIDGMHAIDLRNCAYGIPTIASGASFCPNLAALSQIGVNYVAATTSKPSDSFPGLTAIVSGGTPKSTGVYYDVAYDRSLDAPAKTTGNGVQAGPCTAYTAPTGTTTEYEEGIDLDQTKLNGGAPGAGLTEGSIASIDPTRLPRDPAAGCAPVYPWNFVRTNTIFGVIHEAGGYTAWSDKHPAYSSVAGPGGNTLNDFYSPEINSSVVALPGVVTPEGVSCATVQDPSQLGSWTDSFQNIKCYDSLKVNAILNQIAGKTHSGAAAQMPNLFGMNFQAVSVGQKLIEKNVATGGYIDAAATPTAVLRGEIQFVDAAVGQMVTALKDSGHFEDTLIVITAKHGQSPIDPHRYLAVPGHTGDNGTTPATLLASDLPLSESPLNPVGIGATEDDISLLWLKPGANLLNDVAILEGNAKAIGLGQIVYGPTVALNYNKPGLPPTGDPRTPDIIVTPNVGVTYTGSSKKLSEHGGFAHDDTNVVMLFANPAFTPRTVSALAETTQVAPTILQSLGLNPQALDSVRDEGTTVLTDVTAQVALQ